MGYVATLLRLPLSAIIAAAESEYIIKKSLVRAGAIGAIGKHSPPLKPRVPSRSFHQRMAQADVEPLDAP